MPDLTHDRLMDAQGTARQVVTALLHGDNATAVQITESYPAPTALAAALAVLTSYVHTTWTASLGGTPEMACDGWACLMSDIEADWLAS